MHQQMFHEMVSGSKAGCGFKCDSDFSCDRCIPARLAAEPEELKVSPKKKAAAAAKISIDASYIRGIADSGSAQDLISRGDAQFADVCDSHSPFKAYDGQWQDHRVFYMWLRYKFRNDVVWSSLKHFFTDHIFRWTENSST